ncbi:MAG: hypothetical protein WD768_00290 [Phycisphaeraceae bacterium]
MNPKHDNIKAGFFILMGLVLAVTVIIVLSDFQTLFASTQQVKIYYDLSDNLQGLKPGARVTVGGQPAGEVIAIDPVIAGAGGAHVEGQVITVAIPKSLTIRWDARIELERPPLGSNTTINIASVGQPVTAAYSADQSIPDAVYRAAFPNMRIVPDDPTAPMRLLPLGAIPGQIAGNAFTEDLVRDMGITETERIKIRRIVRNIETITEDFSKLSGALGSHGGTVAEMIDNLHKATVALKDDLPEISESAKRSMAKVEGVVDKADQTMARLNAAAEDVNRITDNVHKSSGKWIANIDAATDDAAGALATLRKLVAEKDPAIRKAIDNIEGITREVQEKTLRQIEVAMEKGIDAIENARLATKDFKDLIQTQRPVLERAIANAQLTTSQLKLAAIEVRRSPWRLLYTPDEKEIETDNLYDAARSFALAATTLDAAARSLQVASEKSPEDKAQLKRMLDDLESLFSKFKDAENEFWKALKDRPPR